MPCRRRSSPRVDRRPTWGEAARREAASLLLNCRPARVEAAALAESQPCRRHEEPIGAKDALRPACLRKKRRDALRSRCPADEAINLSHRTNAQRDGAINPSSPDRCPAGEGPTSNFTRWTWTEDEGPVSNSVDSARAGCEGPMSNSAVASIPSWATLRSTRATGITHPGFYGRKPWRKPNSAFIITATETRCEDFSPLAAKIVQSSP